MPQFTAIAKFKDELQLGQTALTELQSISQPFFDAVRAAQTDKAHLREAFDKIKAAVEKVRPHTDALVSMLVEYANTHGADANIDKIRLGIMLARVAFDGSMQIIPGLIK